ncbi:MAG TPA: cell division protein ZapE [Steroidobacteraceae bacterium]|nr:cell division protein ZapE [Steroidobacteraceae bacterium]
MDLRALYAQQAAQRGFSSDPVQQAVVAHLEDLRSRLLVQAEADASLLKRWLGALPGSSPRPLRGVYLWGAVGRGKTWLMDLFYQSLPFPNRRRRHFHRFMHDVHAELKTLQQRAAPLEIVAERIAREVRVLCFDELFVSDIADAMILGALFAGLFRRGVTLVATSNVPPRELYKDGLQRQRFVPAIELIERHVEVIAVEGGTDYRLRRLTQAGTYLPSGAADTRQRLRELFSELAGDANGQIDRPGAPMPVQAGGTIEIEDRPIAVVRESGSVVWFDFEAVCAGPRSQEDYIEIARDYQSVIVSDVPVLDAQRDNQARRFIALVDELYDRNVNLVVSAAAAPAELYRGERVKFEFERTISRLTEMQSQEYLAREHRP